MKTFGSKFVPIILASAPIKENTVELKLFWKSYFLGLVYLIIFSIKLHIKNINNINGEILKNKLFSSIEWKFKKKIFIQLPYSVLKKGSYKKKHDKNV